MRARAKRTRSMMVVRMPVWVRTCAKAATSPIQSGVEGSESGVVWILTADSVILKECPPFEKKICFFSFRRHLFLRFRQSLLFSYAISLRIPWDSCCQSLGRPCSSAIDVELQSGSWNTDTVAASSEAGAGCNDLPLESIPCSLFKLW